MGLAAISYDSVPVLAQFAQREHIAFPLLSDPDSAVIRRYGILNQAVPKGTPFFGIPHPGTYVLNAKGIVTGKYFEEDFRVRDTASSILLRQFGLEVKQREAVTAKHLSLRTSATNADVRPGQRITLNVDVDLPPRVHVYAPGVLGYIPVALSLKASPAFQADPVVFPKSSMLTLVPIHETVPVYTGHFQLLQTVTLGIAQQVEPLLDSGRRLPIGGVFRYQACDDRECFIPETVPLQWTLHVLPLDRTRVPEDLRRKARTPQH